MKQANEKELCLALMWADTEDEVVELLKGNGYWDDAKAWRYYGDYENNYGAIGNQQSRPEAALVEKIVNAVDGRLICECLKQGIDPEGPDAPQSIREAVASFFDPVGVSSANAGLVSEWPPTVRTEIALGITVSATGLKPSEGSPCITVADSGEGQTPEMIPATFVSLRESNKLRIPFVQGKYNQGGTGVLQFCGRYNLQLIVSKRHPSLVTRKAHKSDDMWGFTVIRRERPSEGRRNSVYTYLAPIGASETPSRGGVLRFSSHSLPIFPSGKKPYSRNGQWGSLVKLYEYQISGKSNILLTGGLIHRVDMMLPHVALPVRFHECRKNYKGHEGSFATNLTGIAVRLEDGKGENLEFEPTSSDMSVMGEHMTATIYAFKKDRARRYKQNEGIVFVRNGQMQGYFPADIFRREKVGMRYIADSILVLLECSDLSRDVGEDLFMASRDRLRDGAFKAAVESELEDLIRNHQGLRELRERRRREVVASKVSDDKPLEDMLRSILEDDPTLSKLFLEGARLSTPFRSRRVTSTPNFVGKRYPTYFKFEKHDYGVKLDKSCHINLRCRLKFETDAVDDYFSRQVDRGQFTLYSVVNGNRKPVDDRTLNLQSGIATLSLRLPPNSQEGDTLEFEAEVTDRTMADPFVNRFQLVVIQQRDAKTSKRTRRREAPSNEAGDDRDQPGGLSLPQITRVSEEDWSKQDPPFNEYTSLRIIHRGDNGEGDNGSHSVYDFFVNTDNIYLNTEIKKKGFEGETLRAQFIYGLVILGLSLIRQHTESTSKGRQERIRSGETEHETQWDAEESVARFSDAAASVILPVIHSLADLDIDDK